MALSDITQKIIEEAEASAKQVRSETDAKAKEILDEARARAEATKAEIDAEAEAKEQSMERKVKTALDSERRNAILAKKREVLTDVFAEALRTLSALPANEKEEILISAISKIKEKEGTIYPASSQTSLIEKVLKKASRDYKIGTEGKYSEGFVFIGKSSEVDFSFDSLIEKEIRPALELEVLKILFDA